MNITERNQIINLVKHEVVPAIGCTEPIAVALCAAYATETLGCRPEKIDVHLSANVLKNAMGVGIPGTGMIGLPIAIALGALIGKTEYQLEVLKDCNPQEVERGKEMIDANCIDIKLKEGISEKLYIEVTCQANGHKATAIIAGTHTNVRYLAYDDDVRINNAATSSQATDEECVELTMQRVWEFATTAPLEEIEFIKDSARLNKAAAEFSLKGNYGHCLGKTMRGKLEQSIMGDNTFTRVLSMTSAACDARMAGAMVPVMSNSGSGNQGIAATMPVAIFAEENGNNDEQFIRALMLSHLTTIYIKQTLGRLSALCGCVVATTGASCGITYLMGGNYENITYAVKNMIANLTGMICDGAKPSCALKITGSVANCMLAAMLAMEGRYVTALEGIIDENVDSCIRNLTRIGSQGMNETDSLVLDIMTHKGC